MSEPDFDKLTELNAELRKLMADGTATQEEFDRLLSAGREAVGDRTEFLEGMLRRGVELGFVPIDD